MQKAEPSLKKESPNLEICLLFITLISKNLAGLSVQTVMNRKINCHRSFNGAGLLKYRVPGGCIARQGCNRACQSGRLLPGINCYADRNRPPTFKRIQS